MRKCILGGGRWEGGGRRKNGGGRGDERAGVTWRKKTKPMKRRLTDTAGIRPAHITHEAVMSCVGIILFNY